MCLITFAWDTDPDYKLILAANRDEFYNRPSTKAGFWEDAPGILAGRDLKAGGTWLGLTKTGKFSAITNYRNPFKVKENAPTRGLLPLSYLKGTTGPLGYLKALKDESWQYNGFNLLVGTIDAMYHYSNVEDKINPLKPGIYGLSNALLNTKWPKVEKAKERLKQTIEADWDSQVILDMMYDLEKAKDSDLPKTGVTLKWERELSPMFIKTPHYGTCNTSVLLLKRNGHMKFVERSYSPLSGIIKEQKYEFDVLGHLN